MKIQSNSVITDNNSEALGEYTHTHTHGNLKNKRVQGYDVARTFAIICVVLCHSIEGVYSNSLNAGGSIESQLFRIVCFTIGRLGVPIFLFLTGALLLKKQIDTDEDVFKFYKKNLLPLFITIEIWNIFYNIFLSVLNKKFNIDNFIYNILFLKQVDMPHMWYMSMILGIYIAIPFLAKIVKTFSLKSIKIPLIIVFISTILLPSVNKILSLFNLKEYSLIVDLSFLGGGYGLYVMLGYFISNDWLRKIKSKYLIIITFLSFFITVFFQYYTYTIKNIYYVWYNFIMLFICAICLFTLFTRIKERKENLFVNITKYISEISLGIFFMHEIILKLLSSAINKLNTINPIKTILALIISFIGSIIIIYLFSFIKVIKKYIFLIKEK